MNTPDPLPDKAALRREIRQRKRQYSEKQLHDWSRLIVSRLLSHSRMQSAQTVLLYHSLPDEVGTHELIDLLVGGGKTVLLPAVVSDTEMELRHYRSAADLSEGAFHIMEPCGERFDERQPIDLAVIPGMAFTAEGHRLGRGKGYYDRLLQRLHIGYTIGICYRFQLLPAIPTDHFDQPVSEVMTD